MGFSLTPSFAFCCIAAITLCYLTPSVAAFGAGNIVSFSQVSGKNWRHGDIEDTLLELFMSISGRAKFDKMAVKRVYFGNWLRDYSQAIDVGGLKQLPKDTIRVLLWVLAFVTFGFATGEFEVTEDRLGCYRPEEHIDNPKDYADNEDARKYDSRLRGPVDEGKELAIDESNGMKAYIASENLGIDTSAGFVRKCFSRSIELGRQYARDGNQNDLYEALRLLGTGLHTLEDFAAHSNYVELALGELRVDAFAHVGENCRIEVNGRTMWPVVTGTFGMTDFLHSVVGEVSDKMVQSEVQALENKMNDACDQSHGGSTSTLRGILDKVPFGLLGLGDSDFGSQAQKIQDDANAKEMESKANISEPGEKKGFLDPEEIKRQATQTAKEIYPILEFHDKVMKAMMEAIDKIPGATELMENLTGAMQIFIFSVLAPYIKPVLERVKVELAAGSEGILEASEKGQYIVWNDDNSNNPTHSMLSKDHFTNVLNELAGRVASEIVRFAVPQIVECWEDEGKDSSETINNILQVLHHPMLRGNDKEGQRAMFNAVRRWWEEKDEDSQQHFRKALSKEGVKEGRNHEGEDPVGGPGGKNHNHASCGHAAATQSQRREEGYGRQSEQSTYGDTYQTESSSGYGGRVQQQQQSSSGGGGGGGGGGLFGGIGSFLSNVTSGNVLGAAENLAEIAEDSQRVAEQRSGNERRDGGSSYDDSSYGRSEYGRNEGSSYSRNEEAPSARNESSSYGGGYSSSRNEESSYGSENRSRNEGASTTYSSRRRNDESSGYGGNNSSSSYDRPRRDESYENTSSYDNSSSYERRGNDDSYESSGYGTRDREGNSGSYGGRNEDEEQTYGESEYSSRRNYGGGNRDGERRGYSGY